MYSSSAMDTNAKKPIKYSGKQKSIKYELLFSYRTLRSNISVKIKNCASHGKLSQLSATRQKVSYMTMFSLKTININSS